MSEKDSLNLEVKFITEYATQLIGCGIHTSRVIRNTKRIAESLGFDIKISVFQRNVILTIIHLSSGDTFSEVVEIPILPISFKFNSELSGLSWEAIDKPLEFKQIKEKYDQIINEPRINTVFLLGLVGLANASLCRLFNGDWISMIIIFFSTIIGFYVKILLQRKNVNHYLVFIVSAFIASLLSSTSFLFKTTSDIALATSVLYLIPGVPLINGVIDVVEGHTLIGISRLVNAFLLIICTAIGLSLTLFMFNSHLI